MVARRAQIEDELEAGEGARHEMVGRAGGALVGVIDNYDGVVGEVRDGERDAVILIGEGVAAIVEVGADAGGSMARPRGRRGSPCRGR